MIFEGEYGNQAFSFRFTPVGKAGYVNVYGHDVTELRQAKESEISRQQELAHVSRLSVMGQMATELAHELIESPIPRPCSFEVTNGSNISPCVSSLMPAPVSLSRSIIESHNGKISFRENTKGGVTLFFSIPVIP